MARKRGGPEVFRITGAGPGLSDDIRKRQRRYAISMSIRTVSFLLAVLLWHVQTVLAVIALVLGGVLPYVAVVIANAGRESGQPLPTTLSVSTRPELGGTTEGDAPGHSGDHGEFEYSESTENSQNTENTENSQNTENTEKHGNYGNHDKADGRDADPRTPENRG